MRLCIRKLLRVEIQPDDEPTEWQRRAGPVFCSSDVELHMERPFRLICPACVLADLGATCWQHSALLSYGLLFSINLEGYMASPLWHPSNSLSNQSVLFQSEPLIKGLDPLQGNNKPQLQKRGHISKYVLLLLYVLTLLLSFFSV